MPRSPRPRVDRTGRRDRLPVPLGKPLTCAFVVGTDCPDAIVRDAGPLRARQKLPEGLPHAFYHVVFWLDGAKRSVTETLSAWANLLAFSRPTLRWPRSRLPT